MQKDIATPEHDTYLPRHLVPVDSQNQNQNQNQNPKGAIYLPT